MGLLAGRHRLRGPTNKSPDRLADRGLVYELFQALVGAVLPDYDHYDDASLLNSFASHATQLPHESPTDKEITRAVAPTRAPFAFQFSLSIMRSVLPNYQFTGMQSAYPANPLFRFSSQCGVSSGNFAA